jgi:Pectate lyase superfamily protein/Right handed beta helix region
MNRASIICCAFYLIALCAFAVGETDGTIINARDFGAKGDGVANDAPALNRAVREGARLGPGITVLIPKGTYLLEHAGGGHLNILDARGLTVQGERGTVLVARHPDADIVRLANCTGTTVKQLVLQQEKTYFTQGTIDAMSADGKSCEVTIDPRYDEPDAPHLAQLHTLRSFSYADTTSYRQDRWWPTVKNRTRTGERKWRLEIEGWALVEDMVKKPFIIWDDKHSSHGVTIEECSDCLIEDVTYCGRGVNAGLYILGCPGLVTMRRFNILTPPGSGALLSCSGGGQMVDCRGSLVWEDCWFDKVDDDGADVFTGYNRVLKQMDPRTLLAEGRRGYATNDLVAILDWPTRVDRHQARIVSCARQEDGNTRLALDRDVTIVRVGPGSGKDWKKAMDDGVDRVVDYNLACSSVTFRNCRLQALRARALNLKAQNCLIEGCTFYDCEMPAIAGGPEFWWGEGPALHEFTVRSNTFVNCNTRCIDIGAWDAGKPCAMRENRNILIEGNTFKHWGTHPTIHRGFVPQCPIAVAYSDGVVIRNNTFEDSSVVTNTVKILIQKSERVTSDGNRNLSESAIERR